MTTTLKWQVRIADDPEHGQPTMIGYGESPEEALADLDKTIAGVADAAMEYATRQATHAAKVRAEVRALVA